MKSDFHKTCSFNPKYLLVERIINFKYNSIIPSFINNEKDENEKQFFDFISNKKKFEIKSYYGQNEVYDFLISKYNAMETIKLDDEFFHEIETKKNIDNIPPTSKLEKNKKGSISHKKRTNKKNHSKKRSKKKSINKNIILNANGKIDKSRMKNIDLIDVVNLDINKEIKQKEINNFCSDKSLFNTIINEIKGK